MTELSKEIFENYQIRKTRAQKSRFISLMQEHCPNLRVEEGGGLIKSRNLVVGDPETASIILGAHYDTCATLPFPNFLAPCNMLLSLGYSLLIALPILFLMGIINAAITAAVCLGFWAMYFINILLFFGLFIGVFFVGVPNRHTANDNTSGVITLVELMESMSDEEMGRCCFVFFDNEENGLLGSALFAKQHKAAIAAKPMLNFDCVSDGEHLLLVPGKKALGRYDAALTEAFAGDDMELHIGGKNTFYPSDQAAFPHGIGVAAFRKAPVVGLYISRIHTKRDTVFEERNIRHIVNGTKKFINSL